MKGISVTTAITTTKMIDFPALSADSRQMQIVEANLEGEPMREVDLVRVPTPLGGATKWTVEVNGNSTTCDELVGLCVAYAKRGVLWPSQNPTEQRPVIVSNDLLVGYRVSDDIGSEIDPKVLERFRVGDRTYDWKALAASPEFGHGAGHGAKRVKESRIIALLREGDVWPVLVSVGPGSLRGFVPFMRRLPTFHYECVLGLKLEKAKGAAGQPYSMIVPRVVGTITEEQGAIARRVYADPLKRLFSEPPLVPTASSMPGDDD
jgi:hypothetical protein